MILELNTSICPILDVGMYHSNLSPESMFNRIDEEIQSSDIISEEEKEYFFEEVSFLFDTKKYKELVARYAAAEIEDFFNDMRDTIKISLRGDAYINSPNYYNYRTDWLIFEVEIDESEIQRIRDTVQNDKDFFTWADRYKSYSGFSSFMPHTKDEYLRAIAGSDLERAVAMFITYMGEKNCHLTERVSENSYQSFLEEKISGNYSYDDFISDPKCLGILEKLRAA
jgi:hypothetical protein